MRRRIAFLAGIGLVVLVLVAWLDKRPLPPAPAPDAAETKPSESERERWITPGPRSAPAVPQPEASLPGTSPLARRLAAGDSLWSLRETLDRRPDDAPHVERAIRALVPHLLRADGWESMPPQENAYQRAHAALTHLTDPRRDTGALLLAGTTAADPYGERMLLRIWTLGDRYPQADLERAQGVLRCWLALAEVPGKGGFDMIVSPQAGRDVFPRQGGPDRAWGVYFRQDEYCVVLGTISRYWRQRVVQHELAHALCRNLDSRFTDSRLVSEGLAEFLEHTNPDDKRLDYGAERFAHEMAALDAMLVGLEAGGARFPADTVQLLLALDPPTFYALRHFGYLVGLAVIGHAGGERVEESLRKRSDRPLRDVLEKLDWGTLRDFVARTGREGRAEEAFVLEDGGPGHDGIDAKEWIRARASARSAWWRLRVSGTLRLERLVVPRAGSPLESRVVGAVIRELFEDRPASAVVTDLSEAMDEGLDLRPWSTEFPPLRYERMNAETPRKFLETVWLLSSGRGSRPPLLPFAESDPKRTKLSDVRPHPGLVVPKWMRTGREPLDRLILCTAGGPFVEGDLDVHWKALDSDELAQHSLEVFRKAYPRGPDVALVIDLGAQPTRYALHWTYVLAAASGFQNPVAYWNPRLPRR